MFRFTLALVAIALIALPLSAQEKGKTKPADQKKPVTSSAQTGAQPSGHIAVEVVLKNEGVFQGVAKKGCLVEKCVRHQYQPMPEEQRVDFGAGIRVWYYDDLLGFLFIPYRQIAEVNVGKELTVDQLEALKAKVEERRQAKEAAREAANKKAEAKKAESNQPAVDAVQDALLTKFPPTSGYSPERFEEIQRASVTGGTTVTALEKEWLKVFPDWLKAYKKASEPKADPAPVVAQTKNGDKPAVKPEVKAEGNLIGVKTPKAQGQSGGDGAGRGLK